MQWFSCRTCPTKAGVCSHNNFRLSLIFLHLIQTYSNNRKPHRDIEATGCRQKVCREASDISGKDEVKKTMQKNSENKKLQVFIADDSELVRERLVSMLCDVDGVEIVGQADDGSHAADLIRELKPDAVTLDINMPGGSGLDVLQEIRRDVPHFKEAPVVIMLSNYSHALYRRKAMNAGANFFFDKSTEFEKVRDVLMSMTNQEVANCPPRDGTN